VDCWHDALGVDHHSWDHRADLGRSVKPLLAFLLLFITAIPARAVERSNPSSAMGVPGALISIVNQGSGNVEE
jgi:hypothetical protein